MIIDNISPDQIFNFLRLNKLSPQNLYNHEVILENLLCSEDTIRAIEMQLDKISNLTFGRDCRIDIPLKGKYFKTIKRLTFSSYCEIESFNFNRFPSLESVVILNNVTFKNLPLLLKNPCPYVTELTLYGLPKEATYRGITTYFPNLKRLFIYNYTDDKSFSELSAINLERLHIDLKDNTCENSTLEVLKYLTSDRFPKLKTLYLKGCFLNKTILPLEDSCIGDAVYKLEELILDSFLVKKENTSIKSIIKGFTELNYLCLKEVFFDFPTEVELPSSLKKLTLLETYLPFTLPLQASLHLTDLHISDGNGVNFKETLIADNVVISKYYGHKKEPIFNLEYEDISPKIEKSTKDRSDMLRILNNPNLKSFNFKVVKGDAFIIFLDTTIQVLRIITDYIACNYSHLVIEGKTYEISTLINSFYEKFHEIKGYTIEVSLQSLTSSSPILELSLFQNFSYRSKIEGRLIPRDKKEIDLL